MEPRDQKDVPPDFSELDTLHKFVSSFLGRVEKVEHEVDLDNDLGAMPNEDTKSQMRKLKDMVNNVENRIQDANDDFLQPENMYKHVDVFHNYYTWINREITRITDHLAEHGYLPLDEHTDLPANLNQIWIEGLKDQGDEVELDANDPADCGTGKSRFLESSIPQSEVGDTLTCADGGIIEDTDMSRQELHEFRQEEERMKSPQTPENTAETAVTANFVTVHKVSPEQDYEQTIHNFKAFFQDNPTDMMEYANTTSFLSTKSNHASTSPSKPDFGTSFDELNSGCTTVGTESGYVKLDENPTLPSYMNNTD